MGRHIRQVSYLMVLGLLFLSLGCGQDPRIEGTVVDHFDQPVAGVKVKITGTTLAVETDDQGRYSVPYYPGSIQVAFRKDGYQGAARDYDIAEAVVIPVEELSLFKRPPEGTGVWFGGATDYVPLEPTSEVQLIARSHGDRYEGVWTYELGEPVHEPEVAAAQRIDDTNHYLVHVAVPLPEDEFVILRDDDSQFHLQPKKRPNDQMAGVDLVRPRPDARVYSFAVRLGQSYAVAPLTERPCSGYRKCRVLGERAYWFRPQLPGSQDVGGG